MCQLYRGSNISIDLLESCNEVSESIARSESKQQLDFSGNTLSSSWGDLERDMHVFLKERSLSSSKLNALGKETEGGPGARRRLSNQELTKKDEKNRKLRTKVAKIEPKPFEVLKSHLAGLSVKLPDMFTEEDWKNYFSPPCTSNKIIKSFPPKVVKAVRKDDLEGLQKLFSNSNADWDSSNVQGETLVHLACREGAIKIMTFLVQQAKVSVKVRDNSGKTPLHEVVWFRTPPSWDVISLLLTEAPELLYVKDLRGWTPLEYTPQKCRGEYVAYLERRKFFLRTMFQLKANRRSAEKLYSVQQRLQGFIQTSCCAGAAEPDDTVSSTASSDDSTSSEPLFF